MPLIVFTGLPCSGKSLWARQLAEQLTARIASLAPGEPGANLRVIHHSDETLGIAHTLYRESHTEKALRGLQMSAVKRDLSPRTVVILDSPAYIKGFRYQLHCEAKSMATSYCLVHVMAPVGLCAEWNERLVAEGAAPEAVWPPGLIEQMAMRYEEPNEQNRWDLPLFQIAYDDEALPFESLWSTLVLKKGPPPNTATLLKPAAAATYLQELDTVTQRVIQLVVAHQQLQPVGGTVAAEGSVVNLPPCPVSISQLQRIRRTYVALNRMHSVGVDRIGAMFVEYLNKSLNQE